MGVKRSNPNWEKEFDLKLKQLSGNQAQVGYFSDAVYPDGTKVAYVAAIQEFGYGKIPPRLGWRFTTVAKKDDWRDTAKVLSKRVLDGKMTGRDAIELVGEKAKSDLLDHMTSNPAPPLKPLTLALRKMQQDGVKITGTLVGQTAARLNAGENVPLASNTHALDGVYGLLFSKLETKVSSS